MSQYDRVREILWEAYKRLVPAAAYLVSAKAGFAASAWVFLTWLAYKMGRGGGGKTRLEMSEEKLIEIRMEINRVRRLIDIKKRVLGEVDEIGREAIAREIEILEKELERLTELYRVESTRYLAWRIIEKTGDERLITYLRRFEEKLEKGEPPSGEELMVLQRLEEHRRRGELKEVVLERMLESLYHG